MKLGLELLASQPATLRLGTFFETWIATPEGTVRRSLGRDEFHLGLGIEAGGRLAATGRTHICQIDLVDAGLGDRNQVRAAVPVPADTGPGAPVLWSIRTNLFLDMTALTRGATARLVRAEHPPLDFGFDHPQVVTDEVAPGRYIVDVSALLLA